MSGFLINHTPFHADLFPHSLANGQRGVVVVVKGTWMLGTSRNASAALAPYDRQVPLYRDPPLESLHQLIQDMALSAAQAEIIRALPVEPWAKHETDFCPPKPRFDVIVNGWANEPNLREFVQTAVAVDHVDRQQHVHRLTELQGHAPRRWVKRLGGFADPLAEYIEPVLRVPLFRPFAFGGQGLETDGSTVSFEQNPSGMGYHLQRETAAGAPLPWTESACEPIHHWSDTPAPVALGAMPIHHLPRRSLQGSYDIRWEQHGLPGRPLDSDPRLHNAAPEALQLKVAPLAGEALVLHNMGDQAQLYFSWPAIALCACPETVGGTRLPTQELNWDTVVIDTGQRTATLVWRAYLPVPQLEKLGGINLQAHARAPRLPPHLA